MHLSWASDGSGSGGKYELQSSSVQASFQTNVLSSERQHLTQHLPTILMG